MDPEQQARVIKLAEEAESKGTRDEIIVVLGSSDVEGALISAETVTSGDPSFTGPLAGVSLGLPVYHILEPEFKAAVPADVYEENVGIWSLAMDIDTLGREFRAVRSANGH